MNEIEEIEVRIKDLEVKLLFYERFPERGYTMAINDIYYLVESVNTLIKSYYDLKIKCLYNKQLGG